MATTEFTFDREMFKTVYYTYTIDSLAANTATTISANDFEMSTPAGYSILGCGRFTSGSRHAAVGWVNPRATGTSAVMGIRNNNTSAGSNLTAGVEIIYVKSCYME